jgi:hypothetical protein
MGTQLAALSPSVLVEKTARNAGRSGPFLAQVMTYGTWSDIVEARAHFSEDAFRDALRHAPPGIFDERSWHYWHYALNLLPIPPRPRREFAADGI